MNTAYPFSVEMNSRCQRIFPNEMISNLHESEDADLDAMTLRISLDSVDTQPNVRCCGISYVRQNLSNEEMLCHKYHK